MRTLAALFVITVFAAIGCDHKAVHVEGKKATPMNELAFKAEGYVVDFSCPFTSVEAGEGIFVVTVSSVDGTMGDFEVVDSGSLLTIDQILIHSSKGRYSEARKNVFKGNARITSDPKTGIMLARTEDADSDIRYNAKTNRIQINLKAAGLQMITAECAR